MQVLITDLTRMLGGRICMAGIDVGTGKRVRPVSQSQFGSRLLASHGGIVGLGRVLDLGRTAPRRSPPEVEDTRFALTTMRHVRTLDAEGFLASLRKSATDLTAIGPDLTRRGRNLVVPGGKGRCSLVIVRTLEPVRLFISDNQRLRLAWADDLSLPVTDCRLYTADLRAPDPARLAVRREHLGADGEKFLCFGLGRPFEGFHWLQLNNIHFTSRPSWSLQYAVIHA